MRNYENLTRIHENTMPPRAHYIPYDSLEKALKGDKKALPTIPFLTENGILSITHVISTVPTLSVSGTR